MATKQEFRIVDVPPSATAEEMERMLNEVSDDGYSLQSLTYSWANAGARAVFRLPARKVGGAWVRE